jgi:hypothetical protein
LVPSEYEEDVEYVEDNKIVLDTESSTDEVEEDFSAYFSEETEGLFEDYFEQLEYIWNAYQVIGVGAGAGLGLIGAASFLEGDDIGALIFTGLGAAMAVGSYYSGEVHKSKVRKLEAENYFDFESEELGIEAYLEEDNLVVELD